MNNNFNNFVEENLKISKISAVIFIIIFAGMIGFTGFIVADSYDHENKIRRRYEAEAQAYYEKKLWTQAAQAYENALNVGGLKSSEEYNIKASLKEIYDNSGNTENSHKILIEMIEFKEAGWNLFKEAADYNFSKNKFKDAYIILKKGIEKFKTNKEDENYINLNEFYEEVRYKYTELKSQRFQFVSEFIINNTAVVKSKDKFGTVYISGEGISNYLPVKYEDISVTYYVTVNKQDNRFTVVKKDGAYLLLQNGIKVYSIEYEEAEEAKDSGEIWEPEKIEKIEDFIVLSADRYGILKNGKWGIYYFKSYENKPGELIPAILNSADENNSGEIKLFDYIGVFSSGYAAAKIGEKWGVIDNKGFVLVPFEYESIKLGEFGVGCSANNGAFFVMKNGVYYLYNIKNGEINNNYYEDAKIFGSASLYAAVKKDGKWGFIDSEGNEVLEFKWDNALSFRSGLAAVKVEDNWGYIDRTGKIVIVPNYKEVKSFYNGYAPVYDGRAWFFIVLKEYEN